MVYYHASTTSPTTAVEFAAAVERAEREEALANTGNGDGIGNDQRAGSLGGWRGGVVKGRSGDGNGNGDGGALSAGEGESREDAVREEDGKGKGQDEAQKRVEAADRAGDRGHGAPLEMVDRELSQAVGYRGRQKVEGWRAACEEPERVRERVERARRNAGLRAGDVDGDSSRWVGKGTTDEPWVFE